MISLFTKFQGHDFKTTIFMGKKVLVGVVLPVKRQNLKFHNLCSTKSI